MSIITQYGVNIIKTRMSDLQQEMNSVMAEMKEVRENSLSSEDNTETNEYSQRYDSLQLLYSQMKQILNDSVVVDVTTIPNDRVTVGSVVTLHNHHTNKEVVYRVVGVIESNPSQGMISYASPIGQEMMGLRINDFFDLNIGDNAIEYEIKNIEVKPL